MRQGVGWFLNSTRDVDNLSSLFEDIRDIMMDYRV